VCGGVGCGGISVAYARLDAVRDASQSTRVVRMWFMINFRQLRFRPPSFQRCCQICSRVPRIVPAQSGMRDVFNCGARSCIKRRGM
jgi:hypothetical protein